VALCLKLLNLMRQAGGTLEIPQSRFIKLRQHVRQENDVQSTESTLGPRRDINEINFILYHQLFVS
jgi:hypothetical protein